MTCGDGMLDRCGVVIGWLVRLFWLVVLVEKVEKVEKENTCTRALPTKKISQKNICSLLVTYYILYQFLPFPNKKMDAVSCQKDRVIYIIPTIYT